MGKEWSVSRTENKYLLSYSEGASLRNKLDRLLQKDRYSDNFRGYMVRSIYFDSLDNHDLQTKIAGTEIRRKVRIRIYDPKSDSCKLELKQKIGDAQHKISIQITKEHAVDLINGRYEVLRSYFNQSENAIKIYSIMVMGCYRPVVLIEYDRIAYTHPVNNTRITFDFKIRSTESFYDITAIKPPYSHMVNDMVILEVKYNGKLLDYISKVLQPYHLNRLSVSKYCMGRNTYIQYIF